MKKVIFAGTIITLCIATAPFGYSAFTSQATIISQTFSTEKFFTKEELVNEIPFAVVDDSELLVNMFDSSLGELVDLESVNEALESGGQKILSLKQVSEIRQDNEDWAEVDFEVIYSDDSTKEYTAILHYEYGTWKLFGTIEI